VYRFPIERAAHIATATATEALASAHDMEQVIFCCFGADMVAAYETALTKLD